MSDFRVERVDYGTALSELRAIRDVVFVGEQRVPVEIERDALDASCTHVLARDADGRPIGTGRLAPNGKIGRMAVLGEWRGRGVGRAMLLRLLDAAREAGLSDVMLHAQVDAERFYAADGFLPVGDRFEEAGIVHQEMRRLLDRPAAVETAAQAIAAVVGIATNTRRAMVIYSRELDPGLLDHPNVTTALRRLATRGGEIRLLLQDVAAPQRAHAPLIALAQRLSSAFLVRVIEEPVDLTYPSAFVANDTGGWYFRPLGHRLDGETQLDGAARVRQLRTVFDSAWERARPATELRALGI
ncbi:GNAT family N-acetyltransferase [Lysobacter sp. TY2-98]|uniref:GNAT family N-acetyltransferase n=1 Tax=Lysobacter sp. TY2-98 TaxID=2290922 RepID=UPI000E2017C4|nr:GNAT family N-acetyltransferase [Lysobacter sp. TY2-98]AXK71878.1 GNAT family N-acetyltransferase [Lysobacter sp. TY2-98]